MASLTKSQLMSELINHGVTPPSPNVKKEKLVQMYEKHVAHHQEAAGEFSSDDEGPTKQQNGDEGSVSSMATDVSELNNEELAEHLRAYGVNVGPIVGSTRRLYERKLSKLLDGAGGAAQRTTATTTRHSTRTITTTVVNGSGSGGGDDYSDSDPEPEPQPPRRERQPEPELRQRRVADTAAEHGYAYSYRSMKAPAPAAASAARSPAVRAVFLRDQKDQPSPRRGVRDVRGSYDREQYLRDNTAAAAAAGTALRSFASTDMADGRAVSASKGGARSGGWLRALFKLCVLLLLLAAAYYCYQHFSEAPSFEELQKAAREAVRRAADTVDGLRQSVAGQPAAKQT